MNVGPAYTKTTCLNRLLLFSIISVISISLIMPNTMYVLARCPNGYHKSPSGDCEKFIPHKPNSLPRCPNGYHRSPDGDCEAVSNNNKNTDNSKTNTNNDKNKKTSTTKTKSKGCSKGFHKDTSTNTCVPNDLTSTLLNTNSTLNSIGCQGFADCFNGKVTEVVDGDTLDVNNVRIRLALVNTPEVYENGYFDARQFTMNNCGVGTDAHVDEDDGQKGGSFGRMIGLVYCGNNTSSINEMLLNSSKASILPEFCNVSEFASSLWAHKYGC